MAPNSQKEHDAMRGAPVPSPQPGMRNLVFFAINAPSGKADRETRSQIRSHVQRHLQNRRRGLAGLATIKTTRPIRSARKKPSLNKSQSCASSELQSCTSSLCNDPVCTRSKDKRREEERLDGRNMAVSIPNPQTRLIRSAMLDPFDQTVVPINQNMHRLLRYCTQDISLIRAEPLTKG
jgi:hypothetical protein